MSESATEQCPKCDRDGVELVDVEQCNWTGFEEVCGHCIHKRSKRYAREGERGQGQRPIGEQHAIDRAERCGSGWPR